MDCGAVLPPGSTCSDPTPTFRWYTSFSQAADENAYSRILIGFHFRKSVEQGTEYGRKIGQRAANLYLRTEPPTGAGFDALVASHSQKCLDVNGGSLDDGAPSFSGSVMAAPTSSGVSRSLPTATRGLSRGTAASAWM